MATATLEFDCIQEQDLTVELYAPGDDTLVYSAQATEYASDLGAYWVPLSAVSSGTYRVRVKLADGTTLGRGFLYHVNAVGVERVGSSLAEVPPDMVIASDVRKVQGNNTAAMAMQALYGGAVVRGQITGNPTTTGFDTDLSETTADAYVGNVLAFTTGNLQGQARRIEAYATGQVQFYIAFPEVPAVGDQFLILGYIE
jgi:hypothetical protein